MSGPDCEVCTNHIAYCDCKDITTKENYKMNEDYSDTTPTASCPRKSEAVHHPKHYINGGYETIDVIEAWELPYNLGNVVKYISRAGRKDPQKKREDLEKAAWYLERELTRLDKQNQ